jgi:polyisoprenoid-binding protein YceI
VYQIVPGESSAQYEVGETFFGEGNRFAIAVGETTAITGTLTVDLQNPQNSQLGPIVADISQLKSDAARRDQALRERFLLTGVSPLATFTPTAISGLPTSYTPGETLTFQIVGDLTVGQFGTRPVTFDVTAQADGATLTGTAVTNFLMSDFGFGPIEIAGILGTEDAVKLTLKLTARAP